MGGAGAIVVVWGHEAPEGRGYPNHRRTSDVA
jgi:hypothetical protein